MEALLALLLIAVVPFLILGVAFKVLFTLVLLPFKILGGLFKAFVGLLGGLFGLVAAGSASCSGCSSCSSSSFSCLSRPSSWWAASSGWPSRPSALQPGRPEGSDGSLTIRPEGFC